MSESKDLVNMVEILSTTIEIQGREEEFYRRSARASTSEVAKILFLEIADDLARYRKSLEDRRRRLWEALEDLKKARRTETEQEVAAEQRDPVCGMKVDEEKCRFVTNYDGKEYRFCSADCKKAFDLAPEKYLKG